MQSDSKEIYRKTSLKTGKSEAVYKDIGNFIQKEVAHSLKKPKSLIIKVRGLGFWYLSKNRMTKMLNALPHKFLQENPQFETEKEQIRFNNKLEFFNIIRERLKEYEKYTQLKKEVNLKKDEYERLYQEQEGSSKSSENKP